MDSHINECLSENVLRYYLDQAALLPDAQYRQLTHHLDGCRVCQDKLHFLEWQSSRVNRLLADVLPVPVTFLPEPNPDLALSRFRAGQRQAEQVLWEPKKIKEPRPEKDAVRRRQREKFYRLFSFSSQNAGFRPPRSRARVWTGAGVGLLLLLVVLLTVPPISTAAGQFLQIFRVHTTVFVPVDQSRLHQLISLGLKNQHDWFIEGPNISNGSTISNFASLEAAAPVVGFVAKVPHTFPGPTTGPRLTVRQGLGVQFTLNLAGLGQTLKVLDINDLTLPDQLGSQPIKVEIPPIIEQRYEGQDYTLILDQSLSPQANLPENVDLKMLSQLALRVLGMDRQQAAALSQQIDLRSALIFPFPSQLNSFKEVQLGANKGLLVNSGAKENPGWVLYWQEGDRFLVLLGQGNLTETDMLNIANSLR